jgi:anti-sigma factor RsiW
MSHISEEELHAYLDQALSRSRCVVIESHLASCAVCQSERDAIAALRDRTTLLLGTLAPPRRIPPALEELGRRNALALPRRQRTRRVLWAASLIGALGAGYGLRALGTASLKPLAAATGAPATTPVPNARNQAVIATTAVIPASMRPVRPTRPKYEEAVPEPPVTVASHRSAAAPHSTETSSAALPTDPGPGLQGVWRTVPWDHAEDVAGQAPARVEGLPVEEVQVQPSHQAGSPMMVVAQRLSSGEVIQTIEGPAADVSQLLSRRGDGGLDSAGRPAEVVQRGDRMLVVTGELPPDSLRAMVRRVNAAMRTK